MTPELPGPAPSAELEKSKTFYVIKTDLYGNYTYVNAFFTERFSFLSNNFIGTPSLDSIDPRDHERCQEAVRECLERPGRVVPVKLRKPSAATGTFWTQWEFSVLLGPDQAPCELLCVGYDISDQENQLQALIENSLDLIFVIRPDGQVEDYFVPDFDGFIGGDKPTSPPLPDLADKDFQEALQLTLHKGKATNIEYPLAKGGVMRWYLATAVRFFYRSQTCVLWVARDITGLKDAQRQAEEQARRVDQILASITDGFLAVDREWRLVRVNRSCSELSGYSMEELQGQPLWKAMPPGLMPEHLRLFETAMQGGSGADFEYQDTATDRWYAATLYPAEDGLSIYLKDITKRKQAEGRVLAQNQRLRRIAFLQSHQVRAPLAAVMGLANLLVDEARAPETRDLVVKLKEQADKLDQIISEIVDNTGSFS